MVNVWRSFSNWAGCFTFPGATILQCFDMSRRPWDALGCPGMPRALSSAASSRTRCSSACGDPHKAAIFRSTATPIQPRLLRFCPVQVQLIMARRCYKAATLKRDSRRPSVAAAPHETLQALARRARPAGLSKRNVGRSARRPGRQGT